MARHPGGRYGRRRAARVRSLLVGTEEMAIALLLLARPALEPFDEPSHGETLECLVELVEPGE